MDSALLSIVNSQVFKAVWGFPIFLFYSFSLFFSICFVLYSVFVSVYAGCPVRFWAFPGLGFFPCVCCMTRMAWILVRKTIVSGNMAERREDGQSLLGDSLLPGTVGRAGNKEVLQNHLYG
jgi:hypothetical protein